jgi:polar amino acid transport system substrate-binding protein
MCFALLLFAAVHGRAQTTGRKMTVGVAGSAPFVVDTSTHEGISLEIWQDMAARLGWTCRFRFYNDVPHALAALEAGNVDAVAGPVSITAERIAAAGFTQPYYQSSLSILSTAAPPTVAERIAPFFSKRFFIAVCVFLLILGGVGALLWLTERERNPEQFPADPARGIANGMWCAIVTMTTTGYGDRAPVTLWGRVVAGAWMVVSIIFATTMVAGIASTLTLTALNRTVISTATDLAGQKTAVVPGSPAAAFVKRYGAVSVPVVSLEQAYELLKSRKVDAVVYDRPQLRYFLQEHPHADMTVSPAKYLPQGYGFAFPLHSSLVHQANLTLLQMEESGRVDRIVKEWLGEEK